MEYICIVDTETTGLNTSKNKVIEIAAIFYHITTRSILSQASTLLYNDKNEAYDINRINVDSLKRIPTTIQVNSELVIKDMMMHADAIIAHNASFDKKFLETIVDFQSVVKDKKWICTKNDVIWPVRKGIPLNLIHICADLGVPIVNTHRAMSDCLLLLSAIEKMSDIETFLDKSGKGREIYHAVITYEQRQLAKEYGFQWDNIKKVWFSRLTPEESELIPFQLIRPIFVKESTGE